MKILEQTKGELLFNSVSDFELTKLIKTEFDFTLIEPYTMIAQRNETPNCLGYILYGVIDVYAPAENGRTTLKGSLEKGECFGVEAFFGRGISFYDAISSGPVECLTISREKLGQILLDNSRLKQYYQSLFIEHLKRFSPRSVINFSGSVSFNTDDRRLKKCIAFIDTHYMENIRLDDAAGLSGLSRFHFSRLFRQATGRTFKEYLTTKRVEAAKRLLKIPEINISQACFSVGFNDASYFARCFRKHEGVTPSRFRKTSRAAY